MIFKAQHFNKYDGTFDGELCLTCRIEDFVVLNFDLNDTFVLKNRSIVQLPEIFSN